MKYYIFLIFMGLGIMASGQDSRLADEYYKSGEYEQAAAVYKT